MGHFFFDVNIFQGTQILGSKIEFSDAFWGFLPLEVECFCGWGTKEKFSQTKWLFDVFHSNSFLGLFWLLKTLSLNRCFCSWRFGSHIRNLSWENWEMHLTSIFCRKQFKVSVQIRVSQVEETQKLTTWNGKKTIRRKVELKQVI